MAIISSAYAAQEASQEINPAEGGAENAGAAGSLAHGGVQKGAFPPFDTSNFAPQLVWLVLIFGVLYLLMSRLALPRVATILSTRETTIGADLDAARESQAKAQAADAQNNATLRTKKEEAQTIGREAQQKNRGGSRRVAVVGGKEIRRGNRGRRGAHRRRKSSGDDQCRRHCDGSRRGDRREIDRRASRRSEAERRLPRRHDALRGMNNAF